MAENKAEVYSNARLLEFRDEDDQGERISIGFINSAHPIENKAFEHAISNNHESPSSKQERSLQASSLAEAP